MSLMLTFWEYPKYGQDTPDDFDGILTVRLKTVKQIPDLIANMPANCKMISTEHSGDHRQRGKITCPTNPRRFKELWRFGQPIPEKKENKCPLCGCVK